MHKADEFAYALLPFAALEAAPHAAPGLIERALAAYRRWREQRQARLELAALDQRLLADIGLRRDGRRIDYLVS